MDVSIKSDISHVLSNRSTIDPMAYKFAKALHKSIPGIIANAKAFPQSEAARWVKEYLPELYDDYLDSKKFKNALACVIGCISEQEGEYITKLIDGLRKNQKDIRREG